MWRSIPKINSIAISPLLVAPSLSCRRRPCSVRSTLVKRCWCRFDECTRAYTHCSTVPEDDTHRASDRHRNNETIEAQRRINGTSHRWVSECNSLFYRCCCCCYVCVCTLCDDDDGYSDSDNDNDDVGRRSLPVTESSRDPPIAAVAATAAAAAAAHAVYCLPD